MIKPGDLVYDDEWGIMTVIRLGSNRWLKVTRKGRLGFCELHEDLAIRLTLLDLYLLNGIIHAI